MTDDRSSCLTLGELIQGLLDLPPDRILTPGLGVAGSYRGYYVDLSFHPAPPMRADACLVVARGALGKPFTGYKGGEYFMGYDALCWHAEYGQTGEPLTEAWLLGETQPEGEGAVEGEGAPEEREDPRFDPDVSPPPSPPASPLDARRFDRLFAMLPLSPGDRDAALAQAAAIVQKDERFWKAAEGKRVRVTRAIVYEGPADWMLKQLGMSMPEGVRDLGSASIRVVAGEPEIIEPAAEAEAGMQLNLPVHPAKGPTP